MVDHRDRVCVPVEMELIPLYRESGWSVRLRRAQKREQRRRQRLSSGRRKPILARLATRARGSIRLHRS